MNTDNIKLNKIVRLNSAFAAIIAGILSPSIAEATILNASSGGTFTTNMERDALALWVDGSTSDPGHFLVEFYNTAESDYLTRTDSSFYEGNLSRTEITPTNLVHDITPVSATNPTGQASGRFVKSTTPNFSVDSNTLAGTGTLGMTGVELYRGLYRGSLIFGDFSLHYNVNARQNVWDELGQEGTAGGWYLQNNISFSAVSYDLSNLSIVVTDADNWKLSGDLILSPEIADFLHGIRLTDAGDFCLGVGSYAGCGQITTVPIPAAVWLFTSGLVWLGTTGQRRKMGAI
jgi:hypothetical protein